MLACANAHHLYEGLPLEGCNKKGLYQRRRQASPSLEHPNPHVTCPLPGPLIALLLKFPQSPGKSQRS